MVCFTMHLVMLLLFIYVNFSVIAFAPALYWTANLASLVAILLSLPINSLQLVAIQS